MFFFRDILISAIVAGVIGAVLLLIWPWARQRGRFAVIGIATAVGFTAWNLTLNATNATGFSVDAPVIGLSWQDAGSGVLAFVVSALVLGLLVERKEPAVRVVGAAAIAGIVAMVFDIFVL